MTQQHKDPPPIAGVHLVKTTSREEDALASDCVDILRAGLRGSSDTDTGAVEETFLTTRAQDEAKLIEREFLNALAKRVKEVCPWADGKRGLTVSELQTAPGWHFLVYDNDGRPFDVQITYHEIYEIATQQRNGMLSNFRKTLDSVCEKLRDKRAYYFARRDSVEVH